MNPENLMVALPHASDATGEHWLRDLAADEPVVLNSYRPSHASALMIAFVVHLIFFTLLWWHWLPASLSSPPMVVMEVFLLPAALAETTPTAAAPPAPVVEPEAGLEPVTELAANPEPVTEPPPPPKPEAVAPAPAAKPLPPKAALKRATPRQKAAAPSAAERSEPTQSSVVHAVFTENSEPQTAVQAPPTPVRPDTPPLSQATYLDNPKPLYPSFARRQGRQGTVFLLVVVTETGQPEAVRIKQSSGSELLDQAAVQAVQQWRFVPAYRQGKAVRETVEIPIRFQLSDS
ncbi:MAG: energy transducer TonB [Magnetococcales bacterium]|nr:energy transducer TonB [Magnetococcales bacterium]MBF0116358.1 energy transducer TonB [Magnetococcales bacterium]